MSAAADAIMRPDEQQGQAILGATLTVTLAALITMVTRLYVRIKVIRNVGWDDYVMATAMALCIVGQCIVVPQVHYGAGRHIEYIEPSDFSMAFKLNFISQPFYLFAIALVKLSVGCFLLRIAVRPFYRRLIIGIMIFMAVYTIGCFFTIVLQCTDLRIMWSAPGTVKGTCWTTSTLKILSYTNSGLNISTDLAFSIFIPIPMLWSVQMNRRQKASLICILGLGIFATAAAIVKLTYLTNYGRSGDWMWDSRNLTIWTVAETNVGIVAGNLPCLKPIFRTILGSTYGRGSRKTSQPYLSGPYGAGTNQRSTAKNYASIHSNRTGEGEFKTYGAAGEAYMLTTIDAIGHTEKGDGGSKSSSGRSSPARESTENIIRSSSNARTYNGLGRIAVTTKVDVTESISERAPTYDEASRHRLEAKQMV